jgi:hypothetical protein
MRSSFKVLPPVQASYENKTAGLRFNPAVVKSNGS